jgi:hypothetical protein
MAVVAAGAAALVAGAGAGLRPLGGHAVPTAPTHAAAALVTVSQTSLPGGNSLSLAVGYRAVWVTGIGVTYQVDEVTGRIARTIPTPGTFPDGCRSGIAIAVADGLVWVTSYHGDLLRIQPRTGQVVGQPIPVGFGDWALVPAAGVLWVTSYGSGSYGGTVSRVDLATGAVQRFGNLNVQAAGAGSLWTPLVQRVDPATGNVTASLAVPGTSQVAFWNGSAWALTVQQSLALLRIDPATDRATGKPVLVGKPLPAALAWGSDPTAIAVGPTGLWVLELYRNLLFQLKVSRG